MYKLSWAEISVIREIEFKSNNTMIIYDSEDSGWAYHFEKIIE